MTTIATRLKATRHEKNWSQDELAKKSGVSQGTIGNIESGARRAYGSLPRIAEALGVRNNWLRDGDLPKYDFPPPLATNHTAQSPSAEYNVTHTQPRGKVPLISWVQAGDFCDAVDPHPAGKDDEWLECPMRHSKNTYALLVRGSSMHNPMGDRSFAEGDIIFIDPDLQPQHRSLVICRLDGSNEATFKRLLIEGDSKLLEALNPSWPDRIIKIEDNATICGVVIGKVESYI